MADVIFNLKSTETYLATKPASPGKYIDEDEILGTYLDENDFAFTFEKIENELFLKRIGRNNVELEREADNIFRQKFDPAFKQEFTRNPHGQLQVTAYYVNHSPYTLTKTSKIESGFDFKSLNGDYLNSETNTILSIKYLEGMNYQVIIRNEYETRAC